MEKMIDRLKFLLTKIQSTDSYHRKNRLLTEYLIKNGEKKFEGLPEKIQYVLNSVVATGQADNVFQNRTYGKEFEPLVKVLLDMEQFYDAIGGVIGYHLKVLELIEAKELPPEEEEFFYPKGMDLAGETQAVRDAVRWGIESLPEMAEIYPVGGAGDRLNLLEEETGEPLPAANLPFLGRSLLEGMLRDLESREYLHFKLTGKKVVTPIAMMTSQEKNNEQHILELIQRSGRDREEIKLFQQPLVPVITIKGDWAMEAALHPVLKPGGHGVIWKLAKDHGIFNWIRKKGRDKALLRQINNPVAGIDYGLLAFTGVGCHKNKGFGFASCGRKLNTSEGMNVVVKKNGSYALSNIEYTDFKQKGIEDVPAEPGSSFSKYPANTNILFVAFDAIDEALKKCTIPGMILNLKNKVGSDLPAGRLETTMQNISDYITAPSEEELQTYLTFNDRKKTISVTKKGVVDGESTLETPLGCFEDVQKNCRELLGEHCGFTLPEKFLFFYHPALGPIYTIIAQKVRKGSFSQGSELQLEIAEMNIENLMLDGSLVVNAESPLDARCTLRNVTVKNLGIDPQGDNIFWKNQISRRECFTVEILGNGEFVAEDIEFLGDYYITVPNGTRVTAYLEGDVVGFKREEISSPSWTWEYSFDEKNNIVLA